MTNRGESRRNFDKGSGTQIRIMNRITKRITCKTKNLTLFLGLLIDLHYFQSVNTSILFHFIYIC